MCLVGYGLRFKSISDGTRTDYCVLFIGLFISFQDRRGGRDQGHTHRDSPQENSNLIEKRATESGHSSGCESSAHDSKTWWRKQQG